MKVVRKIFFILQFSFILIPFAPFGDVFAYAIEEDSLLKGLGVLLYESALNCSDDDISRILVKVLICLTVIGLTGSLAFKVRDKRVKNAVSSDLSNEE